MLLGTRRKLLLCMPGQSASTRWIWLSGRFVGIQAAIWCCYASSLSDIQRIDCHHVHRRQQISVFWAIDLLEVLVLSSLVGSRWGWWRYGLRWLFSLGLYVYWLQRIWPHRISCSMSLNSGRSPTEIMYQSSCSLMLECKTSAWFWILMPLYLNYHLVHSDLASTRPSQYLMLPLSCCSLHSGYMHCWCSSYSIIGYPSKSHGACCCRRTGWLSYLATVRPWSCSESCMHWKAFWECFYLKVFFALCLRDSMFFANWLSGSYREISRSSLRIHFHLMMH